MLENAFFFPLLKKNTKKPVFWTISLLSHCLCVSISACSTLPPTPSPYSVGVGNGAWCPVEYFMNKFPHLEMVYQLPFNSHLKSHWGVLLLFVCLYPFSLILIVSGHYQGTGI